MYGYFDEIWGMYYVDWDLSGDYVFKIMYWLVVENWIGLIWVKLS